MTPLRRRPGEEQYGAPQQPAGQWPPQPQHGHGYGDFQAAPQPVPPAAQGYHFPPPDGQQGYGYPQALSPQQWPQQTEPQPYEINYQAYGDTDPSPFHGGPPVQHQGYGDGDAEFGDGYYEEDDEPRRGRRWFLIAAALVGAIGVGGALAYTYRSLVARPRLEAVKSDPVKVKVGKDLPSPVRAPVKVAEDPPPPEKSPDPPAADDPPSGGGDQGTRTVKTFTIGPGGPQVPPVAPPSTVAPPPSSIPGLSIYVPPKATDAPPAPTVKKEVPPGRVTMGTKPVPPPAVKEEDPPAVKEDEEEPTPPPVAKKGPVQSAMVTPKLAPPPKAPPPSSGLGYVAVLKSAKSHMDAMTAYADLQQKYPEVLGDKSFDVQEADLSSRGLGVMYRVIVGPPGSHNAASGVCTQLKAAGYVGCWVKEY